MWVSPVPLKRSSWAAQSVPLGTHAALREGLLSRERHASTACRRRASRRCLLSLEERWWRRGRFLFYEEFRCHRGGKGSGEAGSCANWTHVESKDEALGRREPVQAVRGASVSREGSAGPAWTAGAQPNSGGVRSGLRCEPGLGCARVPDPAPGRRDPSGGMCYQHGCRTRPGLKGDSYVQAQREHGQGRTADAPWVSAGCGAAGAQGGLSSLWGPWPETPESTHPSRHTVVLCAPCRPLSTPRPSC